MVVCDFVFFGCVYMIKKIIIFNGFNLNLLGEWEFEIYGI